MGNLQKAGAAWVHKSCWPMQARVAPCLLERVAAQVRWQAQEQEVGHLGKSHLSMALGIRLSPVPKDRLSGASEAMTLGSYRYRSPPFEAPTRKGTVLSRTIVEMVVAEQSSWRPRLPLRGRASRGEIDSILGRGAL